MVSKLKIKIQIPELKHLQIHMIANVCYEKKFKERYNMVKENPASEENYNLR